MLIALEGIAGAGKSTQASMFARFIAERTGREVIITKAYGGTRKRLVDEYISSLQIPWDSAAMMFLFQSLHALHFAETIEQLQKGAIVVADRWNQSFCAYHSTFGFLSEATPEVREMLDGLAYRGHEPDLTILLRIPPEVAHGRYVQRDREDGTQLKLVSVEGLESLSAFYERIAREKEWAVVDANRPVTELSRQLCSLFQSYLGNATTS